MAAGFATDKITVDQRLGDGVLALRVAFEDVVRIHTWLQNRTDEQLESLGYSAEDVTLVRGAYFALFKLSRVARGEVGTQADDFFFHAKSLTGLR